MAARNPLSSTPDVLTRALRDVMATGLPVTEPTGGPVLPNQRAVCALAQHPDESASRITATNRLLRDLLTEFGTSPRGVAARTVFGIGRGLRGTTLTSRREAASATMQRHVDHFRKHIEPDLIAELAFAIHEQNLRYTPKTEKTRPAVGAHEDTPVLTNDSYTEQEEAMCRVWSAVYGYRAELIAVQLRLDEAREQEQPPHGDLQDHLDSAAWQLARLLTFVSAYLEQYGETILQGDVPFNVEGLVQLAGWSGGLGGEEAKRLRFVIAKVGVDDRAGFVRGIMVPETQSTYQAVL